jgi:hypothetical protein
MRRGGRAENGDSGVAAAEEVVDTSVARDLKHPAVGLLAAESAGTESNLAIASSARDGGANLACLTGGRDTLVLVGVDRD